MSVGQLPPGIMAERFLLKAAQAGRDQGYTTARAAMERTLGADNPVHLIGLG